MRTRYAPEQKAQAIELAVELGKAEAARRTGISPGTIGSWLTRAGLANADPEGRRERIRVAQETWVERRADLGNRMGEVASQAVESLSMNISAGRTRQARELAGAVAVLVDKAQLLTGGVTERTEHSVPERTPEQEAELARVLEFRRAS